MMSKEEKIQELRKGIIDTLPCPKGNHDGSLCPPNIIYCKQCPYANVEVDKIVPIIQKYCSLNAEKELPEGLSNTRRCFFTKEEKHAFDTGYFSAKIDITTPQEGISWKPVYGWEV